MKETRREYVKRINLVLDFIEKNLDADLSLEYLSKKIHYSPYHFHRVFSTIVGERLNEFVNRKRIERIASIILVEPKIPLKDVAYKYGFNSANSFSRAFKTYYGVSPTIFKIEGKKLLSKIGIEPFSSEKYIYSIENIKQWIKMNAQITIKKIPKLKLARISQTGEFDKASNMFQRLVEWGHQNKVLDTSNFKAITIYHDNPNVTKTSKVRFSTCVTISENISTDGEIRQQNLSEGIYAVALLEIKAEEISKAWKSLCIWIVENGYEFSDGDYFEMYHNDHKTHPDHKFIMDICIPLEETANIKLGEINHVNLSKSNVQNQECENNLDYHQLINYMKELRFFFQKEYDTIFKLGKVYQGDPSFSYFSLTTTELKKLKLKFVIILNHKELSFSICLSGQNKDIRKKYWKIFKDSNWNKYHLAESIENNLSIIDQTIVEEPNFNNRIALTEKIEKESMKFIKELKEILFLD
ncbi:AraC family transcriptional regulator [uncultured Maribacter sp.]|uniref:AraC family transcriptional regulator n=1 Tax=uncultured Maribacter sp. TaxID=431308 RepID=UPI002633582C|nr:AraC family transcriptional regulator [uncultured Maribacter sp.]